MENCAEKKKHRSDSEKRALIARINRIAGQMNGIRRMIEEDCYCTDVLIQLTAIEKAVKSLAAVVFKEHVHSCLVENIQNGDLSVLDELADLFRKF